MLKKRILSLTIACVLVFSITACGTKAPATSTETAASSSVAVATVATPLGDAAAFGKFANPVDVHVGLEVDPTDKTLPAGDTAANNQYTRYLKDKYNINIIVDWTAAKGNDFKQKVSLSIASGKLPDGMVVTDRTYMTKAASAGLLYDLTTLFGQYQSEQVKKIMDTTEGRGLENASYNGKMVSIPNLTADPDGVHVMNIRKDWLDKLKLEIPKTIADVEIVAKAFIDNKMAGDKTIGIAGPSKSTFPYATFLESSNNMGGFDPVFAAFDAYPGYWLDDGAGTVSYGTTTDNSKKALTVLADWYKKGLIDPEMGTRDNVSDPINANQAGIFFGPWWNLGYGNPDSFKNDPTANWQAYPLYTDDGKFNAHMKTTGTSYTLISKKSSEDVAKAILIMNNALVRDETTFDRTVAIVWYPLRNVMAPADECEYENKELMKVLKGETKAEDYNVPGSPYKMLYEDAKAVTETIKAPFDELNISNFDQIKNFGNFQRMYSIMVGDRPFATIPLDKKVYSATYSQTKTMETKWANLKKLEDENVLKIIMGQSPVSAFDKFVTDWKSQGGDEITKEVQDSLK
ncbi:MAG TPA: extracellular solute-binding protein [Ruminiclostridium sp.]